MTCRARGTYTPGVDYVIAVLPSLGTGLLFYIVIRSIVNADRNEREALRRLDDEQPTNHRPESPDDVKNDTAPAADVPRLP